MTIPFTGELVAYLGKDGVTAECEGFTDPTLNDLCRRFLDFGFSPYTKLIVKQRTGKTEVEIATIKLNDPARNRDFDLRNPEPPEGPRLSLRYKPF